MARTIYLLGRLVRLETGDQFASYALKIDHLRLDINGAVSTSAKSLENQNVIVQGDVNDTNIYPAGPHPSPNHVPLMAVQAIVPQKEGFPKILSASSIFEGHLTYKFATPASDPWHYLLSAVEVFLEIDKNIDANKYMNQEVRVVGYFDSKPFDELDHYRFKVAEISLYKGLTELAQVE